ncbi:MAG: type II toxin-antitoxin system Phd/YefM family antitoxin [bacterium]|nr:type II toxin-antitoxin system Phd/YefM family antitoxin [bacterium]
MDRLHLDEDIRPLSEFRANAAALVRQIRTTKRPLVLTQRGHSAAVLIDVTEYERLLDELDTLRDIQAAERELARGEGVPHEEAKKQVLAALEP